MKISIRTRLTLLMALIFFFVFLFLLFAGAVALYRGLNKEIDKKLTTEKKLARELFESTYLDLSTATGEERELLREDFLEKLNEVYKYKNQFAIFSLESNGRRRIYAGGLKNAQLLLPKGFLAQYEGFYDQRLGDVYFRVLITKHNWGTLVLGSENRTFVEIANEFKVIFLIGAPITLLLVFVVGRFLARLAMRPVAFAAESTKEITLTNLKKRLPEYAGNDEFGVLVTTLNSMIARIEEGVNIVQQFTQNAAHELRTPLTILRGELELLYQREDMMDDARAILQKTLDRTISMSKMVDDLMLLAQCDAGRYSLQKQTFSMDELVHEIVEDIKIIVESQPIEIILSECDHIEFLGDQQLIKRLLLNVADNAIKYTEAGQIEFSLQKVKNHIVITIRDTGIGIPKEHLPHVFDRFYRVEKARTSLNDGSGLGLSICKWIVTNHGGEIRIDSAPAIGTTIVITLPIIHS